MEKQKFGLNLCVLLFLIVNIFSIVSLALADDDIVPITAPLVIADLDSLWRDLLIPVCWENATPINPIPIATGAIERRWVQEAIEESWEKVSSVNFTGWGECTTTSVGIRIRTSFNDQAIFEDDDWPHAKKLGNALNGLRDGIVFNFGVFSSEFGVKVVAVHEFGHALGFAHEQNRSDRFECEIPPQGPDGTFYITPYDKESVMNYCAPGFSVPTKLSALDIAGIRAAYGPFSDVIPAKFDVVTTINIVDGEFGAPNERGSRDFSETFVLTNSTTSDEKRMTFCVGNEVRVEVGLRASLLPGTPLVQLASTANMYEGGSCSTREHESLDHASSHLGIGSVGHEDRLVLHNDDIVDDHATIHIRVQPNIERVIEDAMKNGCPECNDEASRAQFVSGNPFVGILAAIL